MTDRQMIEAAVTILPLLHDLLGDRAPDLIRRLSYWLDPARVGTPEAASAVLVLLAEHSETRQWLREYLPDTADTRKSLEAQPIAPAAATALPSKAATPPKQYDVTRIYFATDREPTLEDEPRRMFGGERARDGRLRLGTCHVSIPSTHQKGKLETPRWFLRSIWEDPAKHIVLLRVEILAGADFFAGVRGGGNPALLFIHGYNVTFEDAARRTAQLAWDLKFPGPPILYSWPSLGSPAGYFADEASVEWTADHLRAFLRQLAEDAGVTDLHVIAHSMGNRALTNALRLLALEPNPVNHIREVILTAPDVDRGVFRQLGVDIVKTPRRITMYASNDDLALQASQKFHRYPRAGETGDEIVIVSGIDSVDATGADTSLLAHSYFGSVRSILSDVFYTLSGFPAKQRSDLQAVDSDTGTYFRYTA